MPASRRRAPSAPDALAGRGRRWGREGSWRVVHAGGADLDEPRHGREARSGVWHLYGGDQIGWRRSGYARMLSRLLRTLRHAVDRAHPCLQRGLTIVILVVPYVSAFGQQQPEPCDCRANRAFGLFRSCSNAAPRPYRRGDVGEADQR